MSRAVFFDESFEPIRHVAELRPGNTCLRLWILVDRIMLGKSARRGWPVSAEADDLGTMFRPMLAALESIERGAQ